MNPSPLVIHHDEDVGTEPARGRREREHGFEARAVTREQHDAAEPGLLREHAEVVGDPRPVEADRQGVSRTDRHSPKGLRYRASNDRPARLATITPSSTGSTGFGTCML